MTFCRSSIRIAFVLILFGCPTRAQAQCDATDTFFVRAARVALERNSVTPLLVWVKEEQEAEMREAFEKTMAVRRLNAAAQELADRYFFETVLRLHHGGDGEPFTGVTDTARMNDVLERAEEAMESGVIDRVIQLVSDAVAIGIQERFDRMMAAQEVADRDRAAGRRYLQRYIEFFRYLEALGSPSLTCEPGSSWPRR